MHVDVFENTPVKRRYVSTGTETDLSFHAGVATLQQIAFVSSETEPFMTHNNDQDSRRPWGFYEVLVDTPSHKVKRVTVHAGRRLSLQRHHHRSEHWFIVSGEAVVTVGDTTQTMRAGESVDIPHTELHRIAATPSGDVVFIEVQTGDYFGEDDIERIEDDFGRV